MNAAGHTKLAWCATFAHLLAFETKSDVRSAMRIANPAYERSGQLSPGRAVQLWLDSALTWPGTEHFDSADDDAEQPSGAAARQKKSLSLRA